MRMQGQSQWKAERLSVLPWAWQGRIDRLHSKRAAESLRDANIWLMDVSERIAGLRVPINAGDAEIITLAEHCAREALNLAGDRLVMTIEAVRDRMGRYCRNVYGIDPPAMPYLTKKGKRAGVEHAPAVKRMTDAHWWRGKLRKAQGRALEGEAIKLGYVHRRAEIYASNATVERRGQQKRRNAATLEAAQAVNMDTGEFHTLAEMVERSVANPRIRRGELMTRIAGFEAVANGVGHIAEFVTLTAPSRFHAKKIGAGGTPMDNHRHDGSVPRKAQDYMNKVWQACRSKLKRYGIEYYGFRIAEPHHDGTPHWHGLFFMPAMYRAGAAMVGRFRAIVRRYFLRDSRDESGAKQNRVKFVAIQAGKGTAAGYIAKYVSKNIDGYQVQADLEGDNLSAVSSAPRVEAWASTWGIRQFQQVGGPPVGVWRELRRMRDADPEYGPEMEAARSAADAGNWQAYVHAQGGPIVRRDALPLRVARSRDGEKVIAGDPVPAELTRYGEVPKGAVFGVLEVCRGRSFVSRFHRWEIRRGAGFRGSRTCVNNCTGTSQGAGVPDWVKDARGGAPGEIAAEKMTRESWEGWRNEQTKDGGGSRTGAEGMAGCAGACQGDGGAVGRTDHYRHAGN